MLPFSSKLRRTALATIALLGTACGSQGLSQAWQLDRLRILAVRAEPAEPRPGDDVSFEALYYVPDGGNIALSLWFACLPQAADDFGCTMDSSVDSSALSDLAGIDPETMTPKEQAALYQQLIDAGLIGAEPFMAPTWTAPADALDGLNDTARLEGVSAVVNITAIPDSSTGADDTELAYKRLPISEASTPNHNPDITGFTIDGEPVKPGGQIDRIWGQDVQIEPILADDAIETYLYRTADGTDEQRQEEPYVTWYAEDGSFDQPYGLYPYLTATWSPPLPQSAQAAPPFISDEVREITLIAVARDRRGGMGWAKLTVSLASPDLPW
ncbi:MAG: hypothetical protein GXP62_03755 [Oligoflexia bacterium]|nr:hypothetical protein [Oligoflexia bacterium]